MDLGSRQILFEFKLSSAPESSQLKGLRNCMTNLGIKKGYVVYPGAEDYSLGNGIMALSAQKLLVDSKRFAGF